MDGPHGGDIADDTMTPPSPARIPKPSGATSPIRGDLTGPPLGARIALNARRDHYSTSLRAQCESSTFLLQFNFAWIDR